MNKTIFVILCLCLTILLCSCANSGEESELKVEVISEYIPLLYERSVGGDTDTHTAEYSGKKFFSREEYKKSITEERIVEEFGSTRQLDYDLTWKYDDLSYEIDRYCYVKGFDSVFAQYRTDTNKIVSYRTSDMPNRDYKSPVNPYSSESEYIEYAKAIFSDHAGVSTDNWDVNVQTWRSEYGYSDGFINYVNEEPSYNAEYIITFSKKISGIERCDKMYVRMTNVGEIIELNAYNYDELFEPYDEIKIDKTKIEEAVRQTSLSNGKRKEISDIKLIVQNDKLWAQVLVVYTDSKAGVKAGLTYAVEVARVEE